MQMHEDAEFVSLDQLAECYDGLSKELYKKLWDMMPKRTHTDYGDFGSQYEMNCANGTLIDEHWDKFTEDEQAMINKALDNQLEPHSGQDSTLFPVEP